jgi:multicomponent Na+:H+ antiporter subunit E
MRYLTLAMLLALCWWAWSGHNGWFFIGAGALSVVLTLWVAFRLRLVDDEIPSPLLKLRAPRYWLWLLWQMAKSSWRVARLSLMPGVSISPKFGWVITLIREDLLLAAYANSITLTPGTVAVDVNKKPSGSAGIYVHALEASNLEELRSGAIEQRLAMLAGQKGGAP